MRSRTLATAAVVVLTALAISGCVSAKPETSDGPIGDAPDKDASCNIIATDLAEYIPELTRSADGLSAHTPSTMLSFQEGAVEKLTSVAEKIEHEGVKGAVFAVRDSSAELIPVLEKSIENPDTWTDGSVDADFAVARADAGDALGGLGEICPQVTRITP